MREKELVRQRNGCIVCQLPKEIRQQLGRNATRKGFTREDQLEWLRGPCQVKGVDMEILANHLNGRHDKEDFNAEA